MANITAFGRHTLDWYWSRDNELHVFVEAHLDSQKHHSMCQYFEVRGRHAFGYPAHSNQNNEGNHGGILILHDTAHGLSKVENFDIEGCGYQAFLWEAKARSLLVIAVYFKTSENLQGPTNSKLLARILALIDATNRQYILVGDWNNHPEQFQQTVLSSKFHFQDMEAKAELPTQLQMSMVVMLAKNEKVERPITLTSVLYRTWCRLRKGLMDEWHNSLPKEMDYDRARPGATALYVALERLLRQESNKALDIHGITVLLDML